MWCQFFASSLGFSFRNREYRIASVYFRMQIRQLWSFVVVLSILEHSRDWLSILVLNHKFLWIYLQLSSLLSANFKIVFRVKYARLCIQGHTEFYVWLIDDAIENRFCYRATGELIPSETCECYPVSSYVDHSISLYYRKVLIQSSVI